MSIGVGEDSTLNSLISKMLLAPLAYEVVPNSDVSIVRLTVAVSSRSTVHVSKTYGQLVPLRTQSSSVSASDTVSPSVTCPQLRYHLLC